ncbi:hypothetical protein ACFYS8_17890 [Kitasatospora sp. NPDC004615]|uniref:hypothetical protein n=1 Tax=Kitasatospora sp. NPDC004615 TaxID=3364017 RepID=UPI0036B83C53
MRTSDTSSRRLPARVTLAALTPLALLGLGALSADPDHARLGDPARLAVLAGSVLALVLLRAGWRRTVGGALLCFVLLALSGSIFSDELLRLRGERTELVVTAAQRGDDLVCVLRRADGTPLPHDVLHDCVPPAQPGPATPYLVDPAGWVPPAYADDSRPAGPWFGPAVLAVFAGLWVRVALGAGRRRPDEDGVRRCAGATDRLRGA